MPPLRTLAHLSDLHLDLSPASDAAAASLVEALLKRNVDQVVVTGDLTHQGARSEFHRFRHHFAPLLDSGRLTFIPGNHDRPGDDVGRGWMDGHKVRTVEREGLFLVCVDSTGEHNRNFFNSHGELSRAVVDQVDAALSEAPHDALAAVLLHHHVLPLPEESFPERLATRMGWPHAAELALGAELVKRVAGRCDLVLHGHRHVPRERDLGSPGGRALKVYNAGSSTDLGRFRLFQHAAGRLEGTPTWCRTTRPSQPRTAAHNVIPALQYLMGQLGGARGQRPAA
ncbi:metallophosphoesterase [Corallococcus sp. H22C18031201]|uniref:metallophosphoesterase family protein n=1 Tax=Citreicoccus inhibens TaxID=2849499 RepID=UPI000E746A3C|nr:metallophosphoesterase [Citreicoccus inhibens]MBU8899119.1 metallophosphoesterase [Citreicoccus inhibens]RJS15194.1 metallophosphoesterase [Corallococcus sp. H22C18031201]